MLQQDTIWKEIISLAKSIQAGIQSCSEVLATVRKKQSNIFIHVLFFFFLKKKTNLGFFFYNFKFFG